MLCHILVTHSISASIWVSYYHLALDLSSNRPNCMHGSSVPQTAHCQAIPMDAVSQSWGWVLLILPVPLITGGDKNHMLWLNHSASYVASMRHVHNKLYKIKYKWRTGCMWNQMKHDWTTGRVHSSSLYRCDTIFNNWSGLMGPRLTDYQIN